MYTYVKQLTATKTPLPHHHLDYGPHHDLHLLHVFDLAYMETGKWILIRVFHDIIDQSSIQSPLTHKHYGELSLPHLHKLTIT
jgi:hypothetical protein